ncbi:unnamed protein product, partial [Didymodactylos carnosus]
TSTTKNINNSGLIKPNLSSSTTNTTSATSTATINLNQNQNTFTQVIPTTIFVKTSETITEDQKNSYEQQQPFLRTEQFIETRQSLMPTHQDISTLTDSSLKQAVHLALTCVDNDLSTVSSDSTRLLSTTVSDLKSGTTCDLGRVMTTATNLRCENCLKLRQQLTILIYEVLNLENTMESKICEYVQERLNEIAISKQLTLLNSTKQQEQLTNNICDSQTTNDTSTIIDTKNTINSNTSNQENERLTIHGLSNPLNTSTTAQNNNNNTNLNGSSVSSGRISLASKSGGGSDHKYKPSRRTIINGGNGAVVSDVSIGNNLLISNIRNQNNVNGNNKYRAERTLTFENVIIGDSTLKYLDPARFDIERKTYIKTMRGKRVAQALEFIQTTRFIGTKKIMFHIGTNDLNRDKLSEQEVSEQIKELIVTTKTVSPLSEVYISLIFPKQGNEESRLKTDKLNYLLQSMTSPELKVFVIQHFNILPDTRGCFEDSTHLSKAKGTMLFEENIKIAMGLKRITNSTIINNNNYNSINVLRPSSSKLPRQPTFLQQQTSSTNQLGLKQSTTQNQTINTTIPFNINNNAFQNMSTMNANLNLLNAHTLGAYLSFLVGGFRS